MLLLPWDHLRGRIWLVLACPSSSHYNHGRGGDFVSIICQQGSHRGHTMSGRGKWVYVRASEDRCRRRSDNENFHNSLFRLAGRRWPCHFFFLSQLAGEKSQYLKGGLSVLCRDTREQTKLCESSRLTHSEFQGVTDSQKEGQKRKKGWGMMDDDADEPQRHTIYNIQTTVWIPIPNGWEQSGMPNRNKMRRRCLNLIGWGVVEDLLARCSRRRAASLHKTQPLAAAPPGQRTIYRTWLALWSFAPLIYLAIAVQ